MPGRIGPENSLHQMVEEAVVIIFFLHQGEPFVLPRYGTMNGVTQ